MRRCLPSRAHPSPAERRSAAGRTPPPALEKNHTSSCAATLDLLLRDHEYRGPGFRSLRACRRERDSCTTLPCRAYLSHLCCPEFQAVTARARRDHNSAGAEVISRLTLLADFRRRLASLIAAAVVDLRSTQPADQSLNVDINKAGASGRNHQICMALYLPSIIAKCTVEFSRSHCISTIG